MLCFFCCIFVNILGSFVIFYASLYYICVAMVCFCITYDGQVTLTQMREAAFIQVVACLMILVLGEIVTCEP